MKIYICIVMLTCLASNLLGNELIVRNPAYGVGKHKIFDVENGEIETISSLVKDGYEYRSTYINGLGIKISRISELNNQSEDIAMFNYRLPLGMFFLAEQWIVDVCATQTEIAFIMASGSGYQYFKVTNEQVIAPIGSFLCERDGVNSTIWKVIQLQKSASIFGDIYLDWQHNRVINSINLLNINTIEVKAINNQTSTYSIENSVLKKDGNIVEKVSLFNPMFETENNIIIKFNDNNIENNKDVIFAVSLYKGGKDFMLNLLNQFVDQTAANLIRTKINEAFTAE